MIKTAKTTIKSLPLWSEYKNTVYDLLSHPDVISMKTYIQHGDFDCLLHCVHVSYNSFIVCKRLKLNSHAAARGALLHDFFLYDWHKTRPEKGKHAFVHADLAFKNANERFSLTSCEKDVIKKHMWPLTLFPPRYIESLTVAFIDKICTVRETLGIYNKKKIDKLKSII